MKLTYREIHKLIDKGVKLKVKTPDGYEYITDKFVKKDSGYKITYNDETSTICAQTHNMQFNGKLKSAVEIQIGDVDDYSGKVVISKEKIPEQEFYDFEISNQNGLYIQNGIIHHNSGKSCIIALLADFFRVHGKRVLLLVPNINLLEQFKSDIQSYNLKDLYDNLDTLGGGTKTDFKSKVLISTWQSMILYKSELNKTIKFDVLINDEVHKNAGEVSSEIATSLLDTKYRFGFTGTLPKDLVERMSIQSCLGRKNPVINAQGLINAGLATPLDIKCIYLNYNEEDTKTIQNFKDYHKEEKFIHEHHKRNLLVSKLINKISKKGNTLALYAKIIHGDLLLENLVRERSNIDNFYLIKKVTPSAIKEVNKDDIVFVRTKISEKDKKTIMSRELPLENFREIESLNIFCVDGSVPEKDREYIRQILESHENAVIFGTSQCMSTGVNIKKLHNLVFCQGGKSSITLAQSLGRLMRQHISKEKSFVYDIIDSAKSKRGKENYLLKHFNERLAVYIEEGYPLEEREINL